MIDTRDSDLKVTVPLIFNKFLVDNRPGVSEFQSEPGELLLKVRSEDQILGRAWGTPLCRTKAWELWQDEDGDYVFLFPRQIPPKAVFIENNYHSGVIAYDFSKTTGKRFNPIESVDIRIVVNWLAKFGDLVLHASGVAVRSQGYCFIGASGAGKSTVAAQLASESNEVTILGEDQVVLRYLAGQFWIFGTPWHEHEDRCSPIGVPLKKVYFLDRHRAPGIGLCPPAEGIAQILQTAFVPYYLPEKIPVIMDQLSLLSEQIPFYRLSYEQGTLVLPKIVEQEM